MWSGFLRRIAFRRSAATLKHSACPNTPQPDSARGCLRSGATPKVLTQEQAQQLLLLPNDKTLKGKRDQALLALLLGCGLRRAELAGLKIQDIQQRDGR